MPYHLLVNRTAARILGCLLLGLLTTVGVAWALAAWMTVPMYPREVSGVFLQWERGWNYASLSRFGVVDVWWGNFAADYSTRAVAEIVAEARDRQAAAQTRYPLIYVNEPPRWGTFGAAREMPTRVLGSDTGFGWPMLCAWYQTTSDYVGNSTVGDTLHGGYLLKGELSVRGRAFRALPLRPIWRGLIGNAILFALLWGVLLFLPGAARRARRRRRGWCVQCGYDLKRDIESGCPECGWGRHAPQTFN